MEVKMSVGANKWKTEKVDKWASSDVPQYIQDEKIRRAEAKKQRREERNRRIWENNLKTITLGFEDDPKITVCEGHVYSKVFNRAMTREGWSGCDANDEDLKHAYGMFTKDGTFAHFDGTQQPRSEKYTILEW